MISGGRILAVGLTVALLAAPAMGAPLASSPIRVSAPVIGARAIEVRIEGDARVLAGRRIVVGADGVVRLWFPGPAVARSVTLGEGPARRVTARRSGRRSVVSIYTRWRDTSEARRVRLLEEPGALTAALFSDDGALAEWVAAHSGSRPRLLPAAQIASARAIAARGKTRPAIANKGAEPPVAVRTPINASEAPAELAPADVPSITAIARAAIEATTAPAPTAVPLDTTPAPLPAVSPMAVAAKPNKLGMSAPGTPPITGTAPTGQPRALGTSAPEPSHALMAGALILLAGAAFVLKRRLARPKHDETSIHVLSSRGLGGKHRVSVIEVGQDRFLVATDTAGTRLISRLGGAASADSHADSELLPRDRAEPARPTRRAIVERLPEQITLVGSAATEQDSPIHRLRIVTPEVTPLASRRAAATRSVPLARLATQAVPVTAAPTPRPMATASRPRPTAPTARIETASPATPAPAPRSLYETDAEGLLRLRVRKAA